MARYKDMLKNFIDYDEDEWFEKAVEVDIRVLPDSRDNLLNAIRLFPDKYYRKTGFETSHWFNFQEAVKEHQKLAVNLFKGLFKQMEVEEY